MGRYTVHTSKKTMEKTSNKALTDSLRACLTVCGKRERTERDERHSRR